MKTALQDVHFTFLVNSESRRGFEYVNFSCAEVLTAAKLNLYTHFP